MTKPYIEIRIRLKKNEDQTFTGDVRSGGHTLFMSCNTPKECVFEEWVKNLIRKQINKILE